MGLRYVKGCARRPPCALRLRGRNASDERERQPFASAEDLAMRADLDRGLLERLAECGALESLRGERRDALWDVHAVRREAAPALPLGKPARRGGRARDRARDGASSRVNIGTGNGAGNGTGANRPMLPARSSSL